MLAYADDMVLIAPSWRGLQCLLEVIGKEAVNTDMLFNTSKTVCMYFNPYDKCKTVVGFVAAAVSMPMGGCRAIRPV